MRNVRYLALSAADNLNTNGNFVDANQLVSTSFHAVFGDTSAAGTFKLQASNDVPPSRNMAMIDGFAPTNWVDIPSQTASVTSGAQKLLFIAQCSYRWLRPVYSNTAVWVQSQTINAVADSSGSLNSTYFTLNSINPTVSKPFYVWYNINSAGVDPAVPGKTGIMVAGATNASANTLATATRAALNALTSDFVATGATDAIIITNVNPGPVTAAADGAAATGFTFGSATPGVTPTTVNIIMNAIGV